MLGSVEKLVRQIFKPLYNKLFMSYLHCFLRRLGSMVKLELVFRATQGDFGRRLSFILVHFVSK